MAASPPITDLVDFVLARLDDEDNDLRRRSGEHPVDVGELDRRAAEVHARREVVTSVQQLLELRDQPNEKAVRDLAISILRSLATPFADHPAFREQWHAATR